MLPSSSPTYTSASTTSASLGPPTNETFHFLSFDWNSAAVRLMGLSAIQACSSGSASAIAMASSRASVGTYELSAPASPDPPLVPVLPATFAPALRWRSSAPLASPSSTPSTAARASEGVVTASPALGCCCAAPEAGSMSAREQARAATARARRGATPLPPRPPSGRTSAG